MEEVPKPEQEEEELHPSAASFDEQHEEQHQVRIIPPLADRIMYRQVIPANLPACFEIEQASYPKDEAASMSDLQYRQHFAEKYFRCAVLEVEEDDEDSEEIIGFISATRCRVMDESASVKHDSTGPILLIHSVVVAEGFRRQGIARRMIQNYLTTMTQMRDGVERLVLYAKSHLLPLFVQCGFSVLRMATPASPKQEGYSFHLEINKPSRAKRCWVVDAFTETPGGGNPAAVVLVDALPIDEHREWCQRAAREFNLSETAFCWRIPIESESSTDAVAESSSDNNSKNTSISEGVEGTNDKENANTHKYGIRYYTCNGTEVDLCGHATLGAAAVLFQIDPTVDRLVFCSKYEELVITPFRFISGKRMQVSMNFPQKALKEIVSKSDKRAISHMLERAFPNGQMVDSNILYMGVDEDEADLLVEVTQDALNSIGHEDCNISALLEWSGYHRGVIVCCMAPDDDLHDVWSRFFAPKVGIPEDAVTGSAHCALVPYCGSKFDPPKMEIKSIQKSKRGGTIHCTLDDDDHRVSLIGAAVITLEGKTWI